MTVSRNKTNLPISALDFDAIKSNLKDYLRGQSIFKDYDFEGSGLNIILDLLAYNTHYQAFYANMVANETFLDSAVARPSVASIAKHLGYTPRSAKASRVVVDLNFGDDDDVLASAREGSLAISRGDIFITSINNNSLVFVPLESHRIVVENGEAIVRGVTIYEGRLKSTSYVVNINNTNERYRIPAANVDIDTLVVRVQNSSFDSTGLIDTWTKATDINNLDSESKVFFIQESINGQYEVYFGDGVIGKAPDNGNLITIEYLVTSGPGGNGASDFSFAGDIGAGVPTVVTQTDADGDPTRSFGGSIPESITSIRYYAPRNYQAQERAVTAEDYETLLAREYSDQADSFLVWGGEENDPPQYGKVFISMKPKNGTKLSDQEKFSIEQTVLGKRNLVSIIPTVVNPDYIYIVPNIKVYYDTKRTSVSKSNLELIVRERVALFESENLLKFNRSFRASNFSSYIDEAYAAFTSTSVSFSLQRRVEPLLGRSLNYTIKFDNPILHPIDGYPPVISSTAFGHQDLTSTLAAKPTVTCFMEDDGYGVLRIYKVIGKDKVIVKENAGTVNYQQGTISLTNFNPLTILPSSTNEILFTAQTSVNDINARRNQILIIDKENMSITMVPETFRTDRKETGSPFPF